MNPQALSGLDTGSVLCASCGKMIMMRDRINGAVLANYALNAGLAFLGIVDRQPDIGQGGRIGWRMASLCGGFLVKE